MVTLGTRLTKQLSATPEKKGQLTINLVEVSQGLVDQK